MSRRYINRWLLSYLFYRLKGTFIVTKKPIHVIFMIADHFEPFWKGADTKKALERVLIWHKNLSNVLSHFKDATGNSPKYTFFYPQEEYHSEILDMLANICRLGCGDVEIHLHHDKDTPQGLFDKLMDFKMVLSERHGLLRKNPQTGDVTYGFIHGNWALDNSRRDGRWCGVNNELEILKKTGCYADFTLPSAPSDTQTTKINSIYYAKDNVSKPKSHDTGTDVTVGRKESGDLMIIQGPLSLNWKRRKLLFFPKIENGEISTSNPPYLDRVCLWIKQGIHVKGRPDWIFIKVHTHGAQEDNANFLLKEGGLFNLFKTLQDCYNDGKCYKLHYVTAWEMYNIIKAAEAGMQGSPSEYKNFLTFQTNIRNAEQFLRAKRRDDSP